MFQGVAALNLGGALCAFAAPLGANSDSVLRLFVDLAGNFIWGYLVLALVLAAVGFGKGRWLAVAGVLVCTATLANALPTAETPALASLANRGLPVLPANLHVTHPSKDKFLQLLAEKQPAIVFVQEVSPSWAEVLDTLPAYPYRKIVPRGDPFGIAVLSKVPLEDVTVRSEGVLDIPAIAATVTWEGKKVDIRAVHPFPPLSAQAYVERNRMLSSHAAELTATGRPAIMVGDFNATPWSGGLSVVQEAGVVRATSLAPTWPAHLPAPAVIPIDHITVSRHWGVLSNGRGQDIGSDHFPVMATVYLK